MKRFHSILYFSNREIGIRRDKNASVAFIHVAWKCPTYQFTILEPRKASCVLRKLLFATHSKLVEWLVAYKLGWGAIKIYSSGFRYAPSAMFKSMESNPFYLYPARLGRWRGTPKSTYLPDQTFYNFRALKSGDRSPTLHGMRRSPDL